MKKPIIVWIVDDEPPDASIAWRVVNEVSTSLGENASIYWAADFEWNQSPRLREAVDLQTPATAASSYPDVVILDLCYGSKVEFMGEHFHTRLRDWEVGRDLHKDGRLAFVILWSIHQGKQASEKFVDKVMKGDPRVIPLASKHPELLASRVRELWRRIEEEREE